MHKHLSRLLIGLLLSTGLAQCQQLTVETESGKQTVLTRSDIESLPHVTVTTHGSETTNYEGVTVKAVLEKAGIPFGESLRGKRMASCLLVEAADGYRVVIALPELDPGFTEKRIVLAFMRDGKPLDQKEGQYRVVIPDEKRMARWVRQVTMLKIVNVQ